MEELFVNEVIFNDRIRKQVAYCLIRTKLSRKVSNIALWSLGALFCCFAILCFFIKNDYDYTVRLLAVALGLTIIPYISVGMLKYGFKSKNSDIMYIYKNVMMKQKVIFLTNIIQIICNDKESEIQQISYDQIQKVIETPELVLLIAGDTFVCIHMDDFITGDFVRFKDFIREKCPNIKYLYIKI